MPDDTGATWNGEVLRVWFREVGLPAAATTTVSVVATGALDVVFDHGDESRHSQVAVSGEAVCRVGDDRSAASAVVLTLAPPAGHTEAGGRPTVVRRSFSATVRDLDTGAAAYVSGSANADEPLHGEPLHGELLHGEPLHCGPVH